MKRKSILRRSALTATSLLLGGTIAMGVASAIPKNRADAVYSLALDTSKTLQTFDGWGTTLCWWAETVGGWTMEGASGKQKREEIMDLVFGKDGLDLSIARYNIVGGDDPEHTHAWNYRGMSLVKESENANYNWDADATQLWVLENAYKMRNGDLYVEAFNNSPPYWMTESQCSGGGKYDDGSNTSLNKQQENLHVDNYEKYAKYFADYVNYIENTLHVPVSSIEVMNEPGSDYWNWMGSQEGCKVTQGAHQSMLIKAVYDEMAKPERGDMLKGKIFAGCDETNPRLAYDGYNALYGYAKDILGRLNYHIYQSYEDGRTWLRNVAYNGNDYVNQNKKIWMSEITYGDNKDPRPNDHSHDTFVHSFQMTSDIYKDLYKANANAWLIWQAVESELDNVANNLNYGLIHGMYHGEDKPWEYSKINRKERGLNRGDYYPTKQYYTMGQYSRYIKAGYKIVESGNPNVVAAISPDEDEVVFVFSNSSNSPASFNMYLKDFEGTSATKIVTDQSANWKTSEQAVNGSYVSFDVTPSSITTIVVKGHKTTGNAVNGTHFHSFTSHGTAARAQFLLEDITSSTYTFYYAESKAALPVNGGTTAESAALTLHENQYDYWLTVPNPTQGKLYGVLERTYDGSTYYSSVLETQPITQNENLTYLTLAGKNDPDTMEGTGHAFGQNHCFADQPFGVDPFTGKSWGYVEAAAGDTGDSSSDELFGSVRWAKNGVTQITYKYEVDAGTSYTVGVYFEDYWGVSGRAMDLWVNGADTGEYAMDTKDFTALYAKNVTGVEEGGKYYITVTVKQHAGTAHAPAINALTVQSNSQQSIALGVINPQNTTLEQGNELKSVLPSEVNLATTAGIRSTNRVTYSVWYREAYLEDGGVIYVDGTAEDISFHFKVSTFNQRNQIYYYIDAGTLNPGNDVLSDFDILKNANPTLINRDAVDKYAQDENDWGRLGTSANYSNYWENNSDKMQSTTEGKALEYSEGEVGSRSKSYHIRYRIVNLPAGTYTVEVGVNVYDWGSNNRYLTIYMGDTRLGIESSSYNYEKVFTYNYTKLNADNVVFDMYTITNENGYIEKPILAYLIIKKTTAAAEQPNKPSINHAVGKYDTQITVGNLEEGALLYLIDNYGTLMGERKVTAQDVSNGSYTFTGLDLRYSAYVTAYQFKDGAMSDGWGTDMLSSGPSAPRTVWSGQPDVITLLPQCNKIKSLEWCDGENGEWIDITSTKFFRATHNGTYYVRLTTIWNEVVVESVEVTHVDLIYMEADNSLSDPDTRKFAFNFGNSTLPMAQVKVTIDGVETDITSTGDNHVYYFTAFKSGEHTVTAVSEQGTTKSFKITLSNVKYKVNFDTKGGNTLSPLSLDYQAKITQPADPTRNGYIFVGWFTDENCTTAYDFDTAVTDDVTLYAKWTTEHTVTFNVNGGSTVSSATVQYGNKVTKPTDPTKEGHTFGGWFSNENCTTAYDFDTTVTGDITLYAKWTIIEYTVTFNVNGGSTVSPATVDHGSKVTKPTDPTKEGYTFGGWFSNENCTQEYDFNTAVTGDMTLYAKWTIIEYTVTFNVNGGSTVSPATVDHGNKVTKPADPTKEGHTFGGWFSNENCTQEYDFNTAVTGDITLYAKWTVNKYTVTFNVNGGSTVSPATVEYGSKVTRPTDPTRTDYTFVGWYSDENLNTSYNFDDAVTGNMTLYAKWEEGLKFVVTFVTGAGSAVNPLTISENGKAARPTDPTRTGYTFGGWFTDENCTQAYDFNTAVTHNVTLYAKWTPNQHTVTFNVNGGSSVSPATVDYDAKITKPADPTKEGHTFGGWYTDTDCTQAYDFNTTVTGNVTLYAKWNVNEYTVTFNVNGGSTVSPATVEYGNKVTRPADPTKEGHTFGGWYSDENLNTVYDFNTTVTGNVTLYAKWNVIEYTVTFNVNGGSTVSPATVEYGNKVARPADPTRTGYTFGGWYTDTDCTQAYDFNTTVTGNVTLYAKWTANEPTPPPSTEKHNVTYRFYGSNSFTVTVNHGDKLSRPADPTRDDYTFVGWYADANYTFVFDFNAAITSDTAIYAKWQIVQHTVTFNVNGGSPVSSETVDKHAKATQPAAPVREGYTFNGWFLDEACTVAYNFNTAVTGDITIYAGWKKNSSEFPAAEKVNVTYCFYTGSSFTVSVIRGEKLQKPADPTREGFTFSGWYTDENCTAAYDFNNTVTEDVTLYAKWEKTSKSGCGSEIGSNLMIGGFALLAGAIAIVALSKKKHKQ